MSINQGVDNVNLSFLRYSYLGAPFLSFCRQQAFDRKNTFFSQISPADAIARVWAKGPVNLIAKVGHQIGGETPQKSEDNFFRRHVFVCL
jgi:hypothetical protein